jgi:hypothetical protein
MVGSTRSDLRDTDGRKEETAVKTSLGYYVLAFLLIGAVALGACGEDQNVPGSIVNYAGFAGYDHPLKPVHEISKSDAASRQSFCIGYYDDDGRLARFEKFLDGELFFRFDYTYQENGKILEAKTLNTEGEESVIRFDRAGKQSMKKPRNERVISSGDIDPARTAAFWQWFEENLHLIGQGDEYAEEMLDAIEERLEGYHEGLSFELGRPEGGIRDFIISAEGVRDNIAAVAALVKAAPRLPGWRVIAFRPRVGTTWTIEFNGQVLAPGMIWYKLDPADEPPSLVLYIEGLTESNEENMTAASFILLDNAIGEFDVMTKLGFIERKPLSASPNSLNLKSFHDLSADLDALFSESVPH